MSRTISGTERALLVVDDDVTVTGIAAGGVHVRSGGRLLILGIVASDLEIDGDGRAECRGMLTGAIRLAEGGEFVVSGTVDGAVVKNDGNFLVAVGTVINHLEVTADGSLTPASAVSGSGGRKVEHFRLVGTSPMLSLL